MTDATPYQPTGSGKWIWHKPLQRDVVDCAQFAKFDPRDARIAELETAMREIENETLRRAGTKWSKLAIIQDIAAGALMLPPERDMRITQEEWQA